MNHAEKRDPLSSEVIGAAIEVHKALGPGLLGHAYAACLAHELHLRKLKFQKEMPLPIEYKSTLLESGFRLDFLVEDELIVELKSVDRIVGLHQAQLLTYLRLSGRSRGLLINFNVTSLRQGIKRMVR